ncbi:RNA polymerase sigma factor [Bacillus weihaiensis]|nr:sigma-70 family RNA polymerase sigma factor [Bacillus weihaiensis]
MTKSSAMEVWIEDIYEQYYLDVYRFLICFTGHKDDAEDLTQEVFIRVLKCYSTFNNECHLKTWILSIAKHIAIDQLRRRKFLSIFKDSFFKQLPSSKKLPEEQVQENEEKKLLYTAILHLKPSYRAVVILRGINELTIKETAEILGCKEGKVKIDYYRAIQQLKRKLHIQGEEVFTGAN